VATAGSVLATERLWSRESEISEQQEHYQPFNPNRIVILKPPYNVAASRKPHVLDLYREFKQRHGMEYDRLHVSDAKLDVLLTLVDALANSYAEADFYVWAKHLLLREDLATSSIGNNVGLFHQFQTPNPIITTQGNEADWWLFLCPNGAEFDGWNGEPAFVLFGFVMSDRQRPLEMDLLCRLADLFKRIHPEEDHSRFWKRFAQQRPANAARQLNQKMAECRQEA
jgi:hypothetical protein